MQSSWNKSANQAWTNSITRYGDTITKEPLSAVNGSLKLPSSAGQKLLLQALVYDAVMVGVFGAFLTCVFSCGFSIYVLHLPFSFVQPPSVSLFIWWGQRLGCQQGCGSSGYSGPAARHQQSAWSLLGCAAISLSELGAAVLSTVIKIYSVLV